MNKFRNNSDSGERDRSRSGDSRRPRRGSEGKEKDDKPKSYKAKRSFTKNKSFREGKKSGPSRKSSDGFGGERKPFKRSFGSEKDGEKRERPGKNYGEKESKRPFKKSFGSGRDTEKNERPRKNYEEKESKKPYRPNYGKDTYSERPRKSYDSDDRKSDREEKPERNFDKSEKGKGFKKEFKPKEGKFDGFKKAGDKSSRGSESVRENTDKKRRLTKPRKHQEEDSDRRVKYDSFEDGKAFTKNKFKDDYKKTEKKPAQSKTSEDGLIRLNKYLSNAGIASRREADNLILGGTVKVNGVVVDQLGFKIKPTDTVSYGDSKVKTERKVYLLLNKPKDYITTTTDPRERKTVMELIQGACRERIYPVGRLDRNTTGLLLFTNDGELTTKLTHPKHGIKKVYHVSLNKGLKTDDFRSIIDGIELEDGPIKADDLAFVGEGKKEIGIEVHSGRNRIVRRIFEHLGYDVIKLDRVVFAGLTKKDLPRGKHRFLTAKEVSFLQMIG